MTSALGARSRLSFSGRDARSTVVRSRGPGVIAIGCGSAYANDRIRPAVDLAVSGDDLRDAGVPPGPLLGKILHCLLARVLEDPRVNTREQLMALVPACRDATGAAGAHPDSR